MRSVFVNIGAVGRMSWAESVDGAENAMAVRVEKVLRTIRGREGATGVIVDVFGAVCQRLAFCESQTLVDVNQQRQ